MPQVKRPKGKYERLRLDQLTCDPKLQLRADGTDHDHAMGICKAIKANRGKGLERVKVRRVTDVATRTVKHYVTDGFHTVEGYRLAGIKEVPCDVLNGTWDDAFIDACGANAGHLAKKRTKEDRENAVKQLVLHNRERGVKWSLNKIADVCVIDKNTVKDIIQRLGLDAAEDKETPTVDRDGKARARPPRKTKERSAAEPEVPVTLQGGWREMPLAEFLDTAHYMWANFKLHNIETAGQLWDAMRKGRIIGFMGNDHQHALDQINKLKDAQEVKQKPTPQGKPVYDWPKMEAYFAAVVRMVDDLPRVYPEEHGKPDFQGMHRNLAAFKTVYDNAKSRLTKSSE